MVHEWKRSGRVAAVELGDRDDGKRFALVTVHDDGTVSAATPHDLANFGQRRRPWSVAGVESVASLRSREAAAKAFARLTA
jgi:ribosomal protein L14E/L6E/L27E